MIIFSVSHLISADAFGMFGLAARPKNMDRVIGRVRNEALRTRRVAGSVHDRHLLC